MMTHLRPPRHLGPRVVRVSAEVAVRDTTHAGSYTPSVLRDGALTVGRLVSWLHDTVQLGDADPGLLMTADAELATPLVLPYLSGEPSTGWAAAARAVIVGASSATTGAVLFRAAMEGVALSYPRILEQLQTTTANPQRILAGGRVTQDLPQWLQVLADVLGTPVEPVTLKRATLQQRPHRASPAQPRRRRPRPCR
jgi:gluconokinase